MIINVNIKLNTVFIGSRKLDENNDIRRIARIFGDDSAVKLFTRRIRHLFFKYATQELALPDYTYDTIKLDGVLRLVDPSTPTKIHSRQFINRNTNQEQEEKFESYPLGTQFKFEIFFDESRISINQVKQILTYIGKYDGISQFGFNWGYGKFSVLSINKVNKSEGLNEDLIENS